MRNYEQRLERLERSLASREPEVVVALLQFGNEPVIGWKDKHGFDCRRLPDETEEDVLVRAEADARARAVPEAWGGIVLLAYNELDQWGAATHQRLVTRAAGK